MLIIGVLLLAVFIWLVVASNEESSRWASACMLGVGALFFTLVGHVSPIITLPIALLGGFIAVQFGWKWVCIVFTCVVVMAMFAVG